MIEKEISLNFHACLRMGRDVKGGVRVLEVSGVSHRLGRCGIKPGWGPLIKVKVYMASSHKMKSLIKEENRYLSLQNDRNLLFFSFGNRIVQVRTTKAY